MTFTVIDPMEQRSSGSRQRSTSNITVPQRTLLVLLFILQRSLVDAVWLPNIYWNATNPMFRIDNTDHIIDVNKGPGEFDRVNIYCPRRTVSSEGSSEDAYYIIYNVSKEEYESCTVTNPNARRMLVCDNPNRLSYVTITFRPFSPQPNGPEFHAGRDYYFISTSTGSEVGLDNKFGGKCSTDNMKLIFKVASQESSPGSSSDNVEAPVAVGMKKVVEAQQPHHQQQTTFRLPHRERLPAYETMLPSVQPRDPPTTVPLIVRPKTTPYRPRIMKFSPKQPPIQQQHNVLQPDFDNFDSWQNNELPTANEMRSSMSPSDRNNQNNNAARIWNRLRTTTNDYFNVIREEEAAVPARQTKPRPAHVNSASRRKCLGNMEILGVVVALLAASIRGMLIL